MSYSFAVHHIFPREVMELFSDSIDALFGGAELCCTIQLMAEVPLSPDRLIPRPL
jgi:hypothetical protein